MHRIKLSRMDRAVVRLVYAQKLPVVGRIARSLLWLLGVEFPREIQPGPGLVLAHPTAGLVVHPRTKVGANVSIFQGVTIGRANPWEPEPDGVRNRVILEDGVTIAAGAAILFSPGRDLTIGRGAIVGANAVVTRDIAADEIWAGNPATLRRERQSG